MPSQYPLSVKIDDKGLNDWIAERRSRIRDMHAVNMIVGDVMVKSIRENFLAGGRPDRWKEETPPHAWRKLKGLRDLPNRSVQLSESLQTRGYVEFY